MRRDWIQAVVCAALVAAVFAHAAHAQSGAAAPPQTLSAAGQAAMLAQARGAQPPGDLAGRRAFLDRTQQEGGARQQKTYGVDIKAATMGGVPVRIISPKAGAGRTNAIFLDLHGGGFNSDSGSLTENIPIAGLTGIPVVAALYRLAPEHLAPAAVDDALAIYRELLKTHTPSEIGVYGTSAGAILGPQLMMRLRAETLPMPAVLGVFAGDADLSRDGASALAQHFDAVGGTRPYLGKLAATDPQVSPIFGDLKGFPPTLCMTSTGDFFLSATVNFCRALDAAGVDAKLMVFDGLPHAFWAYIDAPESDQAFQAMAKFMGARLAKAGR
jgi:epsilon-lactone hydrolase